MKVEEKPSVDDDFVKNINALIMSSEYSDFNKILNCIKSAYMTGNLKKFARKCEEIRSHGFNEPF